MGQQVGARCKDQEPPARHPATGSTARTNDPGRRDRPRGTLGGVSAARDPAGRIVVGIDGSGTPERALRWAADEAVLTASVLDVVHAWLPAYPLTAHDVFDDQAGLENAAHRRLLDAVAQLGSEVHGLVGIRERLELDHPAAALLTAAEGADLLVVGTRGRGGFAGLLLGW